VEGPLGPQRLLDLAFHRRPIVGMNQLLPHLGVRGQEVGRPITGQIGAAAADELHGPGLIGPAAVHHAGKVTEQREQSGRRGDRAAAACPARTIRRPHDGSRTHAFLSRRRADTVPNKLEHAGADLEDVAVAQHGAIELEIVDEDAVRTLEVGQDVFARHAYNLGVPPRYLAQLVDDDVRLRVRPTEY
jgi:hypothetical protein